MFYLLSADLVRQSVAIYLSHTVLILPLLRLEVECSFYPFLLMGAIWGEAMGSYIKFLIKLCCKNI